MSPQNSTRARCANHDDVVENCKTDHALESGMGETADAHRDHLHILLDAVPHALGEVHVRNIERDRTYCTDRHDGALSGDSGAGVPVAQIMRKHGISQATYYNWKSKYGGASAAELERLKELEAENAKLRRM